MDCRGYTADFLRVWQHAGQISRRHARAMISAACAQLGERAWVCSGWTDFGQIPHSDHVKVVDT